MMYCLVEMPMKNPQKWHLVHNIVAYCYLAHISISTLLMRCRSFLSFSSLNAKGYLVSLELLNSLGPGWQHWSELGFGFVHLRPVHHQRLGWCQLERGLSYLLLLSRRELSSHTRWSSFVLQPKIELCSWALLHFWCDGWIYYFCLKGQYFENYHFLFIMSDCYS